MLNGISPYPVTIADRPVLLVSEAVGKELRRAGRPTPGDWAVYLRDVLADAVDISEPDEPPGSLYSVRVHLVNETGLLSADLWAERYTDDTDDGYLVMWGVERVDAGDEWPSGSFDIGAVEESL